MPHRPGHAPRRRLDDIFAPGAEGSVSTPEGIQLPPLTVSARREADAGRSRLIGAILGGLRGLQAGAQAAPLRSDLLAGLSGAGTGFATGLEAGQQQRARRAQELAAAPLSQAAPSLAQELERSFPGFGDLSTAQATRLSPVISAVIASRGRGNRGASDARRSLIRAIGPQIRGLEGEILRSRNPQDFQTLNRAFNSALAQEAAASGLSEANLLKDISEGTTAPSVGPELPPVEVEDEEGFSLLQTIFGRRTGTTGGSLAERKRRRQAGGR